MMLYSAHKSSDEIVERGVHPASRKQINELRRVIVERTSNKKKVSAAIPVYAIHKLLIFSRK